MINDDDLEKLAVEFSTPMLKKYDPDHHEVKFAKDDFKAGFRACEKMMVVSWPTAIGAQEFARQNFISPTDMTKILVWLKQKLLGEK